MLQAVRRRRLGRWREARCAGFGRRFFVSGWNGVRGRHGFDGENGLSFGWHVGRGCGRGVRRRLLNRVCGDGRRRWRSAVFASSDKEVGRQAKQYQNGDPADNPRTTFCLDRLGHPGLVRLGTAGQSSRCQFARRGGRNDVFGWRRRSRSGRRRCQRREGEQGIRRRWPGDHRSPLIDGGRRPFTRHAWRPCRLARQWRRWNTRCRLHARQGRRKRSGNRFSAGQRRWHDFF